MLRSAITTKPDAHGSATEDVSAHFATSAFAASAPGSPACLASSVSDSVRKVLVSLRTARDAKRSVICRTSPQQPLVAQRALVLTQRVGERRGAAAAEVTAEERHGRCVFQIAPCAAGRVLRKRRLFACIATSARASSGVPRSARDYGRYIKRSGQCAQHGRRPGDIACLSAAHTAAGSGASTPG